MALDAVGSAAVDMLAMGMCRQVDEKAAVDGLRTTVVPGRQWFFARLRYKTVSIREVALLNWENGCR